MGDDRHPAEQTDDQLRSECAVRFQRRSGPGGQHRNKVETAVYLVHRPTGIGAGASERRSQAENLAAALGRLRTKLALEFRAEWTAPSRRWRIRCQRGRLRVNPRHADFAPLLAEALDALHTYEWDVGQAAEQLGCTRSQLLGLLRDEPRALQLLNAERQQHGLRPLR